MRVTQTIRDLSELLPAAEQACRLLFQECYKAGIQNIFISETYRPQERQNYLYAQGRSRSGPIVTWTKTSRHTSRLAWDIACSSPAALYDTELLTSVGAIARKLNITWGGDWENNIDRPHFEVQKTWTMPNEYKMEGHVIVPSNSKQRVQLIVEDNTKEAKQLIEAKLFNPGSTTLSESVEKYLEQAVKEEFIQSTHLNDFQNNLMTGDRLLGLVITIEQRRAEKHLNTYTAKGRLELKSVFKRAYEQGIFTVDHSEKVDELPDSELTSLLAAYMNRVTV